MSRALNSAANSGLSVGASSLVTDANSALSGGPHLQRSASINAESYNRLPASPMSFSSNNISISGSSVLDGASFVQQSPNQDQNPQQIPQRHQQHGASSASSHMTLPTGQMNSSAMQLSAFMIQEPNGLSPMQKIPRLDVKQEEIFQQQVIQQLLQRQDSVPLHARQTQLQALYQQKFLQQRQQQQLLQSLPQMQRVQLQQQQQSQQQLQQQQLRLQLQQGVQPSFATKRPFDSGICARRLMQYLYHQRHRPPDNSILYWKKFVAEYFAPRAKKRWCLSLYDNAGHHTLGVFPQAAMDAWHCDICGSKSGRGFETTYDVLPRLSKIKFDSGVIDELLFPGMPQEFRFSNGIMSLEYVKAVQESVYEHIRVVREGQLRIVFTPDLKILSWEFCARRHDELLPRRLVAPQVNQLVQVAQKYQNAVNDSGSTGVSMQELQTNCGMFVTAGRQLAKNLDMQSLNELGFSKRYVRCLQIAEVVNSMKDLIDFSREQNMGPIECLKSYPRHTAATKMQLQTLQEMGGQQLVSSQGLSADQNNSQNKKMAMTPGFGSHNNTNSMGSGTPNNVPQTAMSLSKYQNLLRQNSMNSNSSVSQPDGNPFACPNQSQASPFQGHIPPSPLQNASGNVQASSNPLQTVTKHVQSSTPANPSSQQDVIQQLLQEMMSNNSGLANPQSLGGQNPSATSVGGVMNGIGVTGTFPSRGGANMVGFGNNSPAMLNNQMAPHPSRTTSFKSVSNNSPTVSGNSYGMKQGTPTQNRHLPDIVPDIPREFSDSGIFDDEAFDWKS